MSEMTEIEKLKRTMARLREPGGCPWDQEQTHKSLARCLIDETSELLETIDCEDMPHMREELGDVLIQVLFHARLAEERGLFNFEDVARDINEKLIRRHPHVFGAGAGKDGVDTSEKVLVQWDQIKKEEKAAKGAPDREKLFKDMPPRLPALMFAEAVWKQIEKKKLPCDGVVDGARVQSLAARLDEKQLGQMLFEIAAAARQRGLDPEGALRLHATKVMAEIEKKAP
jgi:XTP/dITP diphosphohydrolase/tetrapyrrole methylase family protein/MazG family protein